MSRDPAEPPLPPSPMAAEMLLPPEPRLPWGTLTVALGMVGVPGCVLPLAFSRDAWGSQFWNAFAVVAAFTLASVTMLTVADRLAPPALRPLTWVAGPGWPWFVVSGVGFCASRDPQVLSILAFPLVTGLALGLAARVRRYLPLVLAATGAASGAAGVAAVGLIQALLRMLAHPARWFVDWRLIAEFVTMAAPAIGVLGLIVGLSLHYERKRIAMHGD
ncbi:MAG: hypothetical protein FJ313_02010 [Gemmatimonadetes bacterium]|nr:hypothetical protein [Gemmatimonadota bacterium]